MNKEIALVLTGVMFGLICAGLAAYAYKYYNPTICVVEYHSKTHESSLWSGHKK